MKFLGTVYQVWQLICSAAQGTPPLQVTSTTKVTNLNADKLDDQEGSYYAPIASPTFTGTPKAPTPATADNSTNIATTAFIKAQGYITSASSGAKISVAVTAPASPGAGDFWYQVI